MYSTDFTIPKGVVLPLPTGYRLLVMTAVVPEKTAGGIIRPDHNKAREEKAASFAKVLSMGSEAYKDPDKFPTGAWCEVGDIIAMKPYSGTGFAVGGREFRFINDDTVDGVIPDISLITLVDRS
jgi:co-chaperonin GroES (HSP10)